MNNNKKSSHQKRIVKSSNNIPPYIQLEEFSTTGQDAISSLLLEGITPSEKMLEHLKLLDSGQITPEEFRELGRGARTFQNLRF